MILIDGKPDNCLDPSDRGLSYGDGLFETIEMDAGKPVLWQRHIRRMKHGCNILGLACPPVDILMQECQQLAAATDKCIVKIILTRGSGGRGYRATNANLVRRIISSHAWPEFPSHYYSEGINLYACNTPVSVNTQLAGLKTLCRLEQVLAHAEWKEPEFAEGLMLDEHKNVIEGSKSNVFIIRGNVIATPLLDKAGIHGVVREVVMEIAQRQGLSVSEEVISHDSLQNADEIFVCNSIIKIWPVKQYMGKQYALGKITRALMVELERNIANYE